VAHNFWRDLLDVREWYQRGRVIKVRFWLDCWVGDCLLKITFHKLFQIASLPNIEVAKAFVDGQWNLQKTYLWGAIREEWDQLVQLLSEITLF